MIVSFNRSGKGQNCLRDMLGPLINRVLEDKNLLISTNPVEIYKQWVNQMEMDTGRSSGMPYDVTTEQALEHEEVQKRLNRLITFSLVGCFFLRLSNLPFSTQVPDQVETGLHSVPHDHCQVQVEASVRDALHGEGALQRTKEEVPCNAGEGCAQGTQGESYSRFF